MSDYCPNCLDGIGEDDWLDEDMAQCPECGCQWGADQLLNEAEAKIAARIEQGDRDYHIDADEGRI